MLLLALLAPSPVLAADFLQGDAGAPGMAVVVHVLRDAGGFDGTETLTTDCDDLLVGPVRALDRGADPDAPVVGGVLSAVLYVADGATTGVECTLSVDGVALDPFNDGIDNRFSIVDAAPAPVDGGAGDADGTEDGVITIGADLRSDGGTVVLSSLAVDADETLWFDTSDPDGGTDGNEAFLPVLLLVEGAARIDGEVAVYGEDGGYAAAYLASDGGDAAPGGGGGGVGSNCISSATYFAGDGFTGGGGTASGTCIDFGYGGTGAGEGPDLEDGGEGVFTDVANGALGYAGGTGGGTGMFWGTGGGGGYCCGTAGDGGFGGGGGNGHSEASGWGAGGGAFGTDGENGIGVLGGGATSSYRIGGAGLENGHDSLVPLAGGSGGAGGDSGSGSADGAGGGGGGGALLLSARSISLGSGASIEAWGGNGGDTYGTNPGSSVGGGGGAGGGVHLAAWSLSGLSADLLDLHGGYGGHEYYGYYSGDGGEGRLRVDGAVPPALDSGPTGETATTWQGPAFTEIDDTDVQIASSGSVTLVITDATGGTVAELSLAEDGGATLYSYLDDAGTYLLTLVDDDSDVMGPAGVAVLQFEPDADGDGAWAERYDGDDCDDTDADVNPDADEVCDGIDNDCDGDVDEDDAVDAGTWYSDGDGDGYGDAATAATACEEPDGTVERAGDCDDDDGDINPDAAEVCDGVDNDCDGDVDEPDATDAGTWYADDDDDGWGDDSSTTRACEEPDGYTDRGGDCDDEEARANPDEPEVCDDIDNDCDGEVDEDDATDAATWYGDGDSDGWGDDSDTRTSCDEPDGYVAIGGDCDDADSAYHPGADESDCSDPNDYNCDGSVAYADADADGYAACEECNDGDAAVNPGATEVCNDIDDDCDGDIDEDVTGTWYADADGDGYGDALAPVEDCDQPDDTVSDDTDCDDGDASIHPGAEEVPDDGIDQDCDGEDDETEPPTDSGAPTDDTGEPTGDTGGNGGTDGDPVDGTPGKVLGGCGGCSSAAGSRGVGLAWLALPLLALFRRRRR
ncbi:MAG: putative metal-binding motif-containing protein [Alphaproteobacteria bacterium]|nr:putative metal-binding motif-containing protein [Alphaproteobacteria bacterium]